MSDNGDEDWTNDFGEVEEVTFGGHDTDNGMLHLTVPGLAGAHTLALASASGSGQARRRARIMAWTIIVATIVVPLLLVVVLWAT